MIWSIPNDANTMTGRRKHINFNKLFISNSDGSGVVNISPPDAIDCTYIGFATDGRLFGTYQTADQKWHGYVIPT